MKKKLKSLSAIKIAGFTLIELMIVVAVIGLIAAISIPAYRSYILRSRLSEATTSIASIKSAEESFYTINNCYVEALAHPASIPRGNSVAWDDGNFSPSATNNAWLKAVLGVRPDRNVRFQYQVYASNALSSTNGCGTAGTTVPTPLGCVSAPLTSLVPNSIFGSNYYIVVARGNLSGVTGVTSNIISAIDDSSVIMCGELN